MRKLAVTVCSRRVLLRLIVLALRMMMRRLMMVMSRCMMVGCCEMVMFLCRMVSHLNLLLMPEFIGNACGLLYVAPL